MSVFNVTSAHSASAENASVPDSPFQETASEAEPQTDPMSIIAQAVAALANTQQQTHATHVTRTTQHTNYTPHTSHLTDIELIPNTTHHTHHITNHNSRYTTQPAQNTHGTHAYTLAHAQGMRTFPETMIAVIVIAIAALLLMAIVGFW